MFAFVTNADSVTINKGQVVYAFGATGDRMSVKLANNTSDATSAKTIGIVFSSSIAANGTGYIITQGVIDGLNLGAYNAGDTLYLGATAGDYTSTKPYAPNHLVYVGIVERANAGNGQIYVRIQNGYELDEIHDVDLITNSPVNKDILTYVTGSPNLWKNRSLGTILGGTTSQYVRGDGSLATLPTLPTIYKSTTDGTAITGIASEQISSSQLIPANTFQVGDIVRVTWRVTKTGTSSLTTCKLYVNTTASLVGAVQLGQVLAGFTNSNSNGFQRYLAIKASNNTQTIGNASTFTDFNTLTAGINANINWSVDQYIIFMTQLNTATADVIRTSYYLIEKL
jgi:hypothetical protein